MKKYIFLIAMILLSGCATNSNYLLETNINKNNDKLIQQNKNVIVDLIKQHPDLIDSKIIVTTITNINNLNESAKIGRIISEQLANDLTQKGVHVVEIRMRRDDIIKITPKNGEFSLTRNAKELARIKKADYILVGTYSTYENKLYVNVKVINPHTSIVIASSDYLIKLPNKKYDLFKNLSTPEKTKNNDIFSNIAPDMR